MLEKIKIIDHARCEKIIRKNLLVSLGFSLFLFLITYLLYMDFSYMGTRNKEMEAIVMNNYKMEVLWIHLKILLAYIVIGLVLGLFTVLLKLEKKRFVLLFNIFYWFMAWIHGMKLYPQMFIDQLYAKGGLLKYFQLFITDIVPFIAMYIVFTAVILTIAFFTKRIPYALGIIGISFLLIARFDVSPVSAYGNPHPPEIPNVLIFATDSLRPDRISYNGHHMPTPAMDSLLVDGANFLNLKASMARTLPSWTSIFTSTFPPDHNMRHMFPDKKYLQTRWHTLIDEMNRHNYYTAVVSDFAGDIFPSIDYGFQEVISPEISLLEVLKQRSQEMHYFLMGFLVHPPGRVAFPEQWGMPFNKDPWYVTRGAKKLIKKATDLEKPFFVVAFSSNNHFPYITKFPYYRMPPPKNYSGEHKYGISGRILATYLEGEVNDQQIGRISDLYDSATRLFDDNLANMLKFLKKGNLHKNTIVIIMSDHGENIYEDGNGLGHGDHLRGPNASNMTFGVYSPFENFNGRRITPTARDVDIAATLLDMLGIDIPSSFRGHSLLPAMRGGTFTGYPAYMETGVWYTPTTPFIKNIARIPYPHITDMVRVDIPTGKVSLKPEYEKVVTAAKHKALQLNGRKYIYMPGEKSFIEEYYIDGKRVQPATIKDPAFLDFKKKMVEMFKDRFYLDGDGFIRERNTK